MKKPIHLAGSVLILITLQSCSLSLEEGSESASIHNYANDNILVDASCGRKGALNPDKSFNRDFHYYAPAATRIRFSDSISQSRRDRLAPILMASLTSIPVEIQFLFMHYNGLINVTSDLQNQCGNEIIGNMVENVEGQKKRLHSCYSLIINKEKDLSSFNIFIRDSEQAVTSSTVRAFAFLVTDFFSHFVVNKQTRRAAHLSTPPVEVTNNLNRLHQIFESEKSKVRSFSTNRNQSSYTGFKTYAEAFDSIHCNNWSTYSKEQLAQVKSQKLSQSQLATAFKNQKNSDRVFYNLFPASYQQYVNEFVTLKLRVRKILEIVGFNFKKQPGAKNYSLRTTTLFDEGHSASSSPSSTQLSNSSVFASPMSDNPTVIASSGNSVLPDANSAAAYKSQSSTSENSGNTIILQDKSEEEPFYAGPLSPEPQPQPQPQSQPQPPYEPSVLPSNPSPLNPMPYQPPKPLPQPQDVTPGGIGDSNIYYYNPQPSIPNTNPSPDLQNPVPQTVPVGPDPTPGNTIVEPVLPNYLPNPIPQANNYAKPPVYDPYSPNQYVVDPQQPSPSVDPNANSLSDPNSPNYDPNAPKYGQIYVPNGYDVINGQPQYSYDVYKDPNVGTITWMGEIMKAFQKESDKYAAPQESDQNAAPQESDQSQKKEQVTGFSPYFK